MSNPTITFVSPRRFYDTATVAETHRRLLAEGKPRKKCHKCCRCKSKTD